MGFLILVLILLGISGIVGAIKQSKAFKELGAPALAATVDYEGGHPEVAAKGLVKIWSTSDGVRLAHVGLFGYNPTVITIPVSDIVTLTLDNNIQHVSAGGGRSIGGAVIGSVIAGPIGAIVGSRSSSKIKRIDESKTYLIIRYRSVQLQLIFKGGNDTYNKLARVFSDLNAPTA